MSFRKNLFGIFIVLSIFICCDSKSSSSYADWSGFTLDAVIDEDDFVSHRKFLFEDSQGDVLMLDVDSPFYMGPNIKLLKANFGVNGAYLKTHYMHIHGANIYLGAFIQRSEKAIGSEGYVLEWSLLDGANQVGIGEVSDNTCEFGLRCRTFQKQENDTLYKVQFQYPNDYHGEQLWCPNSDPLDLMFKNLKHPQLYSIVFSKREFRYKGYIDTL